MYMIVNAVRLKNIAIVLVAFGEHCAEKNLILMAMETALARKMSIDTQITPAPAISLLALHRCIPILMPVATPAARLSTPIHLIAT